MGTTSNHLHLKKTNKANCFTSIPFTAFHSVMLRCYLCLCHLVLFSKASMLKCLKVYHREQSGSRKFATAEVPTLHVAHIRVLLRGIFY